MESHSVLGTLWAGFGMSAYYIALLWINILLAAIITSLFLIPGTWLLDRIWGARVRRQQQTTTTGA